MSVPAAPSSTESDVTVVVPVRDRPDQLRRLLEALDGLRTVVVDDASADPAAIAQAARDAGATLVALERQVGPGAARNVGMAGVTTRLVALVDSDCLPYSGWLGPPAGPLRRPDGRRGGAPDRCGGRCEPDRALRTGGAATP